VVCASTDCGIVSPSCRAPVRIDEVRPEGHEVRPEGHETPGSGKLLEVGHRWQPVLQGKVRDHSWPVGDQGIARYEQRAGAPPDRRLQGTLEILGSPHLEALKLQAK
jgi:hypothetical protein